MPGLMVRFFFYRLDLYFSESNFGPEFAKPREYLEYPGYYLGNFSESLKFMLQRSK
jgi:hypothetical protein